jgi:O-acetylserine/cysteine efflux transporter
MKPRHVAVAVMIAAIWGANFVAIDVGLGSMPPLLFASLRFVAAAFPAILFVRRPAIPWRWFAIIGLPLGVGQFGLLFTSMHIGMPAGLSSLVLQSQALFTPIFAAFMLRERPRRAQVAGIGVAFAGIALIGLSLGQGSPLFAFTLCVAAAATWGLANIGMRKARPPDAFAFMVWLSLVPPLPLLAMSLLLEGPRADLHAIMHISFGGVGALLYIAYISTLVGFGAWGWLMRHYDAGQVAMYSLLVPPFGMSSAALFLGERITLTDVLAALLIVGGVALGGIRRRTVPAASRPVRTSGEASTCTVSTSRS